MDYDPEAVAARIRDHSEVDAPDLETEVDQKLFTSLVGDAPQARLLTVFLTHPNSVMHQDELCQRAGIEDLDAFATGLAALHRLGVVEVGYTHADIPYFRLDNSSDTVTALTAVQDALVDEQVTRLADKYGSEHTESSTDSKE